jgi:hypothetical protein
VINVEDVDPKLLDQAVRQVCATRRSPDRELAIASHLGESAELLEWLKMILSEPPPDPDPRVAAMARICTAVAVGLEIGYALGARAK